MSKYVSDWMTRTSWPKHPSTCVCKGNGYVKVPRPAYFCNCGSGEGCDVHNDFWIPKEECTETQEQP